MDPLPVRNGSDLETAVVASNCGGGLETVIPARPPVIPAKAGIQEGVGRGQFSRCTPPPPLDSRFRGNDGGGTEDGTGAEDGAEDGEDGGAEDGAVRMDGAVRRTVPMTVEVRG